MKTFKILGPLDIFKKPLFLRIDSQEKISTSFGVIISLIIYAVLIYSFSQSDVFKKASPKIIDDTIRQATNPLIEVSNRLFLFAVMDDNQNNYYDPTIFDFQIINYLQPPNSNVTYNIIKTFHFCTPDDFLTPTDLDTMQLAGSICLDDRNFTLDGGFNDAYVSVLVANINVCQNSSDNNYSCQSIEEIDQFFSDKTVGMIYTDTLLKSVDYENPFGEIYHVETFALSLDLTKTMSTYFQKFVINTENGVLFSNVREQDSYVFQNRDLDISLTNKNDVSNAIFSNTFFSSPDILLVTRTYQSLPEAIAILGGLFSFLFACGNVLSFLDKKLIIKVLAMNHLYSFQNEDHEEEIKNTTERDELVKERTIEFKMEKPDNEFMKIELTENKIVETEHKTLKYDENKIEPNAIKDDSFVLPHESKNEGK